MAAVEAQEREVDPQERGVRSGVALMLAVAAVVAAALAGRASLRAESAFDAWQQAGRAEVKHGAALVEDVRFVYADEGPSALRALEARVRAEELREAARRSSGRVRATLLLEARTAEALANALEESGFDLGREAYRNPDGGLAIHRRLADVRGEDPALVALDPEAHQARGNRAGDRAVLGLAATIPVGVAFLFGALGQALPRRRRGLVLAGWGCIAGALVIAVLLEVL